MYGLQRQRGQGAESQHYCLSGTDGAMVQIEELSKEDMGYDADVEIVKPDQYEEPESETDGEEENAGQDSEAMENQLAVRLRKLSCDIDHQEQEQQRSPVGDGRSRKRMSKEMQGDPGSSQLHLSDFEVTELIDELEHGPPAKRRQRRSLRKTTDRGLGRFYDLMDYESSNSIIDSGADSPSSAAAGDADAMAMG
jgi:hypothetical protein